MKRNTETDAREDERGLTRRDMLQRAGWVVAAAAFPSATEAASPHVASAPFVASAVGGTVPPAAQSALTAPGALPISNVMTRLSIYMSEARDRALPDKVIEQAKWHLLDTIAA